jgi:hypothetical protein
VFRTSRATLARLPLYCFCGVRATHKCLAFLQFLREFWPMPLPLMIHSALALFAQRTRIPTSARSIGFCVIWVCISSSSSSSLFVVIKCFLSKNKSKNKGLIPADRRIKAYSHAYNTPFVQSHAQIMRKNIFPAQQFRVQLCSASPSPIRQH